MAKKLFVAVLAVAAAGCRMCSNSCDYSPAVAGSPHNAFTSRAGSASYVAPLVTTPPLTPAPVPPTPPTAGQPTVGPQPLMAP
jgi:hypothetical protein